MSNALLSRRRVGRRPNTVASHLLGRESNNRADAGFDRVVLGLCTDSSSPLDDGCPRQVRPRYN